MTHFLLFLWLCFLHLTFDIWHLVILLAFRHSPTSWSILEIYERLQNSKGLIFEWSTGNLYFCLRKYYGKKQTDKNWNLWHRLDNWSRSGLGFCFISDLRCRLSSSRPLMSSQLYPPCLLPSCAHQYSHLLVCVSCGFSSAAKRQEIRSFNSLPRKKRRWALITLFNTVKNFLLYMRFSNLV